MPGWRTIVDWIASILLALALVLAFEAEIAKPYRIPSSSMEPTLHCARPGAWCEGSVSDRVIANRLAYRFESPQRGQVVVFTAPKAALAACGEGGIFVKRLIGLPGDTVNERNGFVYIDGKLLKEPYIAPALRDHRWDLWTVPRGHYFFMGDDRIHSCDSRDWGSVPRSALIGPVLLTYWPPNRWSFH